MQASAFLTALGLLAGCDDRFREKPRLMLALACYAAAVMFEQSDKKVFMLTGEAVSGHTLKHLMAGLAGYIAYRMIKARGAKRELS